jgi:hypothetical protein
MAQDTTIGHGAPGIASFVTESFGSAGEPRYGEGVPTTTDEVVTVGADVDLPIYSVVSVIAGVLALASIGTAQGAATGTITQAVAAAANNDTVTINGRVYTFKTALSVGPTVPNEVLAGANLTASATNLAAAINGTTGAGTLFSTGTTPNAHVSATSAAGVVTVTARDPGDEGNAITLAEVGSNTSVSGATLTGGSDDPDALPFGILAHPVVMLNGESMSVSFYREGHWDMDQLNWHASFATDAQKKKAFENSRSPNIFISKKKFNNNQIAV